MQYLKRWSAGYTYVECLVLQSGLSEPVRRLTTPDATTALNLIRSWGSMTRSPVRRLIQHRASAVRVPTP